MEDLSQERQDIITSCWTCTPTNLDKNVRYPVYSTTYNEDGHSVRYLFDHIQTTENMDEIEETSIAAKRDKLTEWKRWLLVLPIETAFVAVVILMAYQGKTLEALAACTGVLGPIVGYYFGTHKPPEVT